MFQLARMPQIVSKSTAVVAVVCLGFVVTLSNLALSEERRPASTEAAESTKSQRSAPASRYPQLAPLPSTAPAPADNPTTPAKVELGKQLFFDPRLSGNNTMSCASCHMPDRAMGDGVAWNKGETGVTLVRNTQTILNVGFYARYFWDGRSDSLEDQALKPIESAVEMNQPLDELERELNEIPGYASQFQSVFGAKPNRGDTARALAAFQRTLVSGPSPFDRYLLGDENALSPNAKRGLKLFAGAARCVDCHHGPHLSDGEFHRIGTSEEDEGLAMHSGKSEDRYLFRTPSLRNVADTAPYMHDGSFHSIDEVLEYYYNGTPATTTDGSLPIDAPDLRGRSHADIDYLKAFLETLSGPLPKVSPPSLPPGPRDKSK